MTWRAFIGKAAAADAPSCCGQRHFQERPLALDAVAFHVQAASFACRRGLEQFTYTKENQVMDALETLQTFVRVVETGCLSTVAREMNASQSSVSRKITQLEDHFGVRLFHRTTRHLSLTDGGLGLCS